MPPDVPRSGRSVAAQLVALICAALTAAVLIGGWGLHIDTLVRFRPEFHAMMPATAASFMCLSVALLAVSAGSPDIRTAARWSTILVALVALLSLLAPFAMKVLAQDVTVAFVTKDRMSVGTSFGLILAAICIYALLARRGERYEYAFLGAMFGMAATLSILFGHSFDPTSPLSVPGFAAMSVYSAIAFALLFLAVLLECRHQDELDD
ncbi:hypothetical protein SAMN04490244_10526 [Tranquillimonas rosea]|uniref:Uncharacterized protein n=1 Tax=Tranquillimonas rosea TaxID=641238 RepID=A0A1H9U4X3_9RHOB|nr:hypothetical protein [Tranquillimonas rosea]SES04291.1 hypothetical protein SAMN04490244_10526 [Tranquillimonas rosea]